MNAQSLRIAGDHKRKLSRRVRLNKSVVAAATCPAGEARIAIYDTETPRLVLLVTAGSKVFYAYAKSNGQPIRYRLGSADVLGVDEARRQCLKALTAPGGLASLAVERKAEREANTVGDLFEAWFDHKGNRKRTGNRDVDNFRRWCDPIARKPVKAVDGQTIANLHSRIGDRSMKPVAKNEKHVKERNPGGPFAANRTLAMLSAVFRWGVRTARCEANPCAAVERFAEVKRERFFQPDELPKLVKAIESLTSPGMRDFFWLCLLTGARRSNVAGMRWADVDFVNRQWRIPGTDAKAGRMIVVSLDPEAMRILQARANVKLDDAWVFPSTSKSGHMVNPNKAWAQLKTAAGIADVRMHDLRRTLGSYMAINGASSVIIGGALGQSSQQATAVYSRLTVAPVRVAVESATATILELGRPKENSNPKKGGTC